MLESIELRIARNKIRRYERDADERLLCESRQAQECMECEQFLDLGVTALTWLERAEEAVVEAVAEGVLEITPDFEKGLEALHEAWLNPCPFAEKWIAECQQNGYEIRNLAEFKDCCERARDWLERNASYKLSKAAHEERFAQEPW